MITITIIKNGDNAFLGFECSGHANYAPEGEDIVCAGVSALVINTVNCLDRFTNTEFVSDYDEKTGDLIVTFQSEADHDADLLMRALVLGLQEIQKALEDNYEHEYIQLNFEEV